MDFEAAGLLDGLVGFTSLAPRWGPRNSGPSQAPLAELAELPSLRAGLALGVAFNRYGDWYGNTVKLASRVTGVARPGSVLATEEVRDPAAEDFAWSSAGPFKLKGVSEPVSLYRARRLSPPDSESDGESHAPERAERRPQARKERAGRSRRRGPS